MRQFGGSIHRDRTSGALAGWVKSGLQSVSTVSPPRTRGPGTFPRRGISYKVRIAGPFPVSRCLRSSFARAVVLALTLALALRPPAVAEELPTLGEVGADDFSPGQERALGEQIMHEVRADPSYLPDPDAVDYLNKLGYELVASSQARHIDFEFFVLRDPMINAFALPGGFIGVHTATILNAQGESELASVVAHEIGHVQQRHIARMIARQRDSTMIALGSLLLALLAARAGSSQGAEAAVAVGQAAALQKQLNFSRDNEREADRVGFQILVDAGFDARAMASFFTRMQQGTRIYETIAPAYLRTHPLTVERIADIQDRLKGVHLHQRADSLDFTLVRARLRVLQDDSTQGAKDAQVYFADQIAHHTAQDEVAAYYGLAMAQLRLKQSHEALQSAVMARGETRAPSAMLDKLVNQATLAAAGNDAEHEAALKATFETTTRFPLSRLTAIEYADELQKLGRHKDVIDYLHNQLALTHSDARYFQLLAVSHAALQQKTLQHQATAEVYLLEGARAAAVEQLKLARNAGDADFYTMSEVDARLREISDEMRQEVEAKHKREEPKQDPDTGKGKGKKPWSASAGS
jgi:beta-barrel assembly-enhancing protease